MSDHLLLPCMNRTGHLACSAKWHSQSAKWHSQSAKWHSQCRCCTHHGHEGSSSKPMGEHAFGGTPPSSNLIPGMHSLLKWWQVSKAKHSWLQAHHAAGQQSNAGAQRRRRFGASVCGTRGRGGGSETSAGTAAGKVHGCCSGAAAGKGNRAAAATADAPRQQAPWDAGGGGRGGRDSN